VVTLGTDVEGVAGVVVPGAGELPFDGSALLGGVVGFGVPMLVLPGAVVEVPLAPGGTVVMPLPLLVELGTPVVELGLPAVPVPTPLEVPSPPVLPGSVGAADVLGVPIELGVFIEPDEPIAPVLPEPLTPGVPAWATMRHPPKAGRPVATDVFATRASTAAGGTAAAPCPTVVAGRINAIVFASCTRMWAPFSSWPDLVQPWCSTRARSSRACAAGILSLLMWPTWMPHLELLLRILVGTVLGGAIGYERDLHGRPAGLRTHALVALASATFMVISTRFVYFQHYAQGDLIEVDASRIAASVVSGIGFLGGGAILRDGITIKGLTTAAGLWLVAAIGMAAGGGMYVESVFVTLIGLMTLTLLRRFEDRGVLISRRRVSLTIDTRQSSLAAVKERVLQLGGTWKQQDYERQADQPETRVVFDVGLPASTDPQALVDVLERDGAIRAVKIQQL
jgi:putative Mg2+ transporter-C (MgtC) family protein